MAIIAAPFALKNLGLDAEPLRQAVGSLVPNSGGIVQAGDLAVTQTTTPSLGVSVNVGRAWMPGTNTSNLPAQAYSTQGQYFAINDAPFPVNLGTANASNPRIDVIFIGATDTFYGGATDAIKLDKVTGVPSATPVVPPLPPNSIALAQVAVAANATVILNANITAYKPRILVPSSALPAAGAGWTLTGTLDLIPTANGSQVIASVKAIYSGGSFAVNGSFVSAFVLSNTGFLPAVGADAYGYFMLRASGTRAVKADCCLTIDSTGTVYIRTLLGQAATTFASGDEMDINAIWNV